MAPAPQLRATTNKHTTRRTRSVLESMKKSGDLRGYFGQVKKGRPKKIQLTMRPPSPSSTSTATAASTVSALSMSSAGGGDVRGATVTTTTPGARKQKKTHTNWSHPVNFSLLRTAVLSSIRDGIGQSLSSGIEHASIARSVLHFHRNKFAGAAVEHCVELKDVTAEMVYPKYKSALLSAKEVQFLVTTIEYRDASNNGMSRSEVISLIMQLKQTSERKKCEDHYDYLIRSKQLQTLKRHGRVVGAQATTTKRSQVMPEQQLRWHTALEEGFADQRRLNLPADEFDDLKDHFTGNFDETCFMSNAHGDIKVVATNKKIKTEKISDDCRASITSCRTGTAAGTQGSFIFLAKGTTINHKCYKGDLHNGNSDIPKHSKVIMTPTAYMTDEVWGEFAEDLCKGIRAMPVVCDHPQWWFILTMDGYGSHVNVHTAHETFARYKIFVFKEEGDSSATNQSYDQEVAKLDKKGLRDCLTTVNRQVKMDQWYLISLAIEAQLRVPPECWIRSHIKVNTHPKHRVSFEEWMKKLDKRGLLLSGESFFQTRRSLYDAMPACWIRLSVEERHDTIRLMDGIYAQAKADNQPVDWSKETVVALTKYVKLEEVVKLRACYLASKKDPAVICGEMEVVAVLPPPPKPTNLDDFFSWKPTKLMDRYMANRTNPKVQKEAFNHMTNATAQSLWNAEENVEPSAYLDVAMEPAQHKLLNPTSKDVLTGQIIYDVKGDGAVQKLAKRRLDTVDGNIASYARCLSDPKRLKNVKELNRLVAGVAAVSAGKDANKRQRVEDANAKSAELAEKKRRDAVDEEMRRREMMPLLEEVMAPFLAAEEPRPPSELAALTNKVLQDIIKYCFQKKVKGLKGLNKEDLVTTITALMDTK